MRIPSSITLARAAAAVAVSGCMLAATPMGALAAKPRGNAAPTSCAATAAAAGQQYSVSGAGFAAGTNYMVNVSQPSGTTKSDPVTADSNGNVADSGWAYWAGSYQVTVVDSTNHAVASCSFSAA